MSVLSCVCLGSRNKGIVGFILLTLCKYGDYEAARSDVSKYNSMYMYILNLKNGKIYPYYSPITSLQLYQSSKALQVLNFDISYRVPPSKALLLRYPRPPKSLDVNESVFLTTISYNLMTFLFFCSGTNSYGVRIRSY